MILRMPPVIILSAPRLMDFVEHQHKDDPAGNSQIGHHEDGD